MKLMCFECCHESNVTLKSRLTSAKYHNKEFEYTEEYFVCNTCDNEVHSDELYDKNIKKSIEFFQRKNNMLSAANFKYIRETIYDLSVRTLAVLIGCSPATISKYENGALQSKQHDLQFKSLISPKNMSNLIEASKDDLKPIELQKIRDRLNFLLEAVKVEELLKGLDAELVLPNISEETKSNHIPPLDITVLESYFITKGHMTLEHEENDTRISNLKLQKLMYVSVGWYSAITEEDLITSDIEAWKHGPVIKDVYHKYKHCGYNPIPPNKTKTIEELQLHPKQLEILDWVWDRYSHFDSKFLEDISHNESPWENTRIGLAPEASSNRIIPKKDIYEYYKNIYVGLKTLKGAYNTSY